MHESAPLGLGYSVPAILTRGYVVYVGSAQSQSQWRCAPVEVYCFIGSTKYHIGVVQSCFAFCKARTVGMILVTATGLQHI